MVDEIYKMKNEILQQAKKEVEERGGIQRADINRLGEMVDMVKDLAEAEEKCWKAEYYRTVTEAMKESDKSGYSNPMGRSGYQMNQNPMERSGYGNNMGYSGNMGHGDLINKLGEEYRKMDQNERMRMKNEILSTLGAM